MIEQNVGPSPSDRTQASVSQSQLLCVPSQTFYAVVVEAESPEQPVA